MARRCWHSRIARHRTSGHNDDIVEKLLFNALLVGLLLAIAMESIWPRYVWTRRARALHICRNASLWLFAAWIVSVLSPVMFSPMIKYFSENRWGLLPAMNAPVWIAATVGFLAADLTDYLFHRLSHRWKWLWLLHSVHHSDRRLDASTTLRQHPLTLVLTLAVRALVIVALGAPLWSLLLRDVLTIVNSHFHHAAVAWPPRVVAWTERYVSWLIVPPTAHWLHHDPRETYTNCNFGAVLSWWDRLFSTYVPGTRDVEGSGLGALNAYPWHTVRGMLTTPWRARNFRSL